MCLSLEFASEREFWTFAASFALGNFAERNVRVRICLAFGLDITFRFLHKT